MFITARCAQEDILTGYALGCDDYIVKPFAFEELLARIRCVLRRPAQIQQSENLSLGDIRYEPHTLTLRNGARETVLSKRLGDLLELFLRNPGQTLPRETILLRVWGLDSDVEKSGQLYLLSPQMSEKGRINLEADHTAGCRLPIGGRTWSINYGFV